MPAPHNIAQIVWEAPNEDFEIVQFHLEDHLSEPHLLKITVKSPKANIPFDKLLYADAKISIAAGSELGDRRIYGGVITRFAQVRTGHGNLPTASVKNFYYDLEIRSPLWPLTLERLSKVYQDLTSQDIVKDILDSHQIEARWDIQGSLKTRPYCIQYRESSFDFISRLLEDDGVFYFFDHKDGKVVFADHSGAHEPCPISDKATYMEDTSLMLFSGQQEMIQKLRYEEAIDVGTFAARDYNYETSQIDLTVTDSEGQSPSYPKLQHYHHETAHQDPSEGEAVLKRRKESVMAQQKWIDGYGFCRAFATGYTFSLSGHYNDKLNQTRWLLLGISIEAEQGRFRCNFKAMPVDIPYRPLLKTRLPRIYGVQTATVVGPKGAQVYLDDLGRCKVQFHWDREGKKDDTASIWIRVSNGYAGKDYGIQWIPRIGHDVLISFVDGNPDRPMVTGRVYNDFNTPPLGPAKKYQNIIKTIKDNHILFDDDDGKELVDIRAQKDMSTLVLNDKTTRVGNDNTQVIKKNRSVLVEEEDYTEKVAKGNYRRTVKKDDVTVVEDGKRMLEVQTGEWIAKVKSDVVLNITSGSHHILVDKGNQITKVKTDKKTKVDGNYGNIIVGDYTVKAKGAGFDVAANGFTAKSSTNVNLEATSNIKISCAAGIDIECGANKAELKPSGITLTSGASSIKINPSGVEISGPMVTLKGLIKHNC